MRLISHHYYNNNTNAPLKPPIACHLQAPLHEIFALRGEFEPAGSSCIDFLVELSRLGQGGGVLANWF